MKEKITKEIENNLDSLVSISKCLYEHPELGGEEYLAAKTLTDELKDRGFQVEEKICGLETAFRAVYDSGKAGASVAFFCEYDALPSIGHGCGHNLIASMSLGAAIGLKSVLDEIGGKIFVFGTPAEETNGAKVQMAREGIFDGITVGIMTHPSPVTEESGTSMALYPMNFQYRGKASHAAASPEKGINALDAVILLFNSINALRQHVTRDVMFHGIITAGGEAPNVVPDFTEAKFYIRAANKKNLMEAVKRVEDCAYGTERITGAKVTISCFEAVFDDMRTNKTLSEVYNKNLMNLGEDRISPASAGIGSIDMGNVSHVIPSIHPWIGFGDENLVIHTREFAERTITEEGKNLIRKAAAAMAMTGYDVITSYELQKQIIEEFLR
ncbi:M20 family metallopeptidase [Sinanaerobacter chloroacetimidivorans]|uniref:Peptidase M20 domain-containing protein 2 n=1 Tax=Sinanaerobacter chloroacetimidivorans TaxID=2818044 RepID=A0A8J8B425_9FIRM|nr:M20 family metallopeptidase [Sinanaerobacter chloroacetimidivorans]MBR0600356.1 M20 family metallopeptidase [Sinanaerobacter chloroacetimidivorans]